MINNFTSLFNSNLVICLLIVSYILGSVPFGLILTKLTGYGDIRKIGSGNIGATNVLRTGNKLLALLTLIFDVLKSFLILIIVKYIFESVYNNDSLTNLYIITAFLSILGHMYSPFLKFTGGKGIATSAGVLLFMSFPAAILTAFIWLLVAIASKKSSLGALISSLSSIIFLWSIQQMVNANILSNKFILYNTELYLIIIIIVLIWIKHIPNIMRLLNKSESNIN